MHNVVLRDWFEMTLELLKVTPFRVHLLSHAMFTLRFQKSITLSLSDCVSISFFLPWTV